MKRLLSAFLTVVMLFSMAGTPVIAADTPAFPEVGRVEFEFELLDGSGNPTGNKGWFAEDNLVTDHSRGTAYIKQNSQYKMHATLYDTADNEIQQTITASSMTYEDQGNPLNITTDTVSPAGIVIQTPMTSTGYSTPYRYTVSFSSVETGATKAYSLTMEVHSGSLGLMNVKNTDGTAFSGGLDIAIFYKDQTGNGSGSYSNGYSYGGVMPLPFQDSLANLNYAYIVARPSNNSEANSPFVDLTNAMAGGANPDGQYALGTISFQYPTSLVTPRTSSGAYWSAANLLLRWQVTDSDLQQSGLHDVSMTVFSLSGTESAVKVASIGDKFGSATVVASAFNSTEMPSEEVQLPVGTVASPAGITVSGRLENFRGNVLMPDGSAYMDSLKQSINGYSRDVSLTMYDVTDPFVMRQVNSLPRADGTYGALLEDGHKYTASIYFDMGDFDDVDWTGADVAGVSAPDGFPDGLTDSYTVTFTYHQNETVDTWPVADMPVLDGGIPISFSITDGVMHMNLRATEPITKGYVMAGSEYPGNGEMIMIFLLDTAGNTLASGMVHSSNTFSPSRSGLFLLGAKVPNLPNGSYLLRVMEPATNLDYTGCEFQVTVQDGEATIYENSTSTPLTKDSDGYVTLQLPESKVKGKIRVNAEDVSRFENSYQRVYVNVFDEAGRFLTKGRVRSNGDFAVANLAPGRYLAQAFVSPYARLATEQASKYGGSQKIPFTIPASGAVTFDLPLQRVVGSGIVQLPNGSPAWKNFWVRLYDDAMNELCAVSTNEFGQFSIPDFGRETVIIKAFGSFGFADSTIQTIPVVNGTLSGTVVMNLTNPQLTGKVVAGDADPQNSDNWISSVDVLLYDAEGRFVSHYHDANGTGYQFGGMTTGRWYLQAIPASPVSGYVQTGLVPIDVDITQNTGFILQLPQEQITGNVLDPDGDAYTTGWVWATPSEGNPVSTRVTSAGTYSFGGLEAGTTYFLSADAESPVLRGSEVSVVIAPDVGEPTVQKNIMLMSRASLQGRMTHNGQPAQQRELYVYDATLNPIATLRTDWFGEFRLNGLAAGQYKLYYRNANDVVEGTDVTVSTANAVDLVIVLD